MLVVVDGTLARNEIILSVTFGPLHLACPRVPHHGVKMVDLPVILKRSA
jgi:hypothetical protein